MPTTVVPADKANQQKMRVQNPKRKMVRMASVDKNMMCSTKFQVSLDAPLPEMSESSVRLRVCFAGYEISGVVDEVGSQAKTTLTRGDRVLVYQEEDIGYNEGYSEYVIINNPENIVPLPRNMSLEVAALLPCGGLTAYTACMRAKPYIQECEQRKGKCNMLVVGAGGLGLWTTVMASHLSGPEGTCDLNIKVLVADTCSEKLTVAKKHGCYRVVHWPNRAYEEQVLEITRNASPDGIDVIIDFVSSPRTISRALKLLNKRGILVVGGNSQHTVSFNLSELAKNEHTVIGVRKGTREELLTLINLVSSGMVTVPQFDIFQLEQANAVFQGLSDSRISGRAVLQVSSPDT